MTKTCIITECSTSPRSLSLCVRHYRQIMNHGHIFTTEELKEMKSIARGHGARNKGSHWKIKDTSNMRGRVPRSAFKKGHTPWSKGLKNWLSDEHRQALRNASLGKTPWNKGKTGVMPRPHNKIGDGVTPQSKLERKKFRKTTQMLIFQRDDFTCQICEVKGGNLQVDHIKRWAEYPELRFRIDNCRTLCMGCHYYVTFKRKIPAGIIWGHNLSKRKTSYPH